MRKEYSTLSLVGLLLFFLIPFHALSQAGKKWPGKQHDCSGNCFAAEVISFRPDAGGCTEIEMRVSHDGACRYELSHMIVEMPCGYVRQVKTSEGCGYDFGKDPTTGIRGLKFDGLRDFGSGPARSFTVTFTWCNNDACLSSDCWEPLVAFKAATCVDYDTARNSCQAPPLTATMQKQEATCSGSSDGSLSVSVDGGQGPYTYRWSTGCDVSSIDNLPAGSYTVTITDAQGNEVTVTEVITSTSRLELTALSVNPTCLGAANGTIDLAVQGGIEPYTYQWNTGATTEDIANLAGGSYSVVVTDSTGCSKQATFQLVSPVIVVSGQILKPACGQSNGQIDVSVSGGAEPYSFLWSNGSTSAHVSGLAAGLYSVVVTDAHACPTRTNFFLAEDNTLRISFQVTPTGCADNTGEIDLTVTGGTPPYAYSWQNGSTAEDQSGLPAGVQRVTVTDAAGYTAASLINVFKQSFQVSSQVVPPSCSGEGDGSITVSPIGVSPFTYLWTTGATSNSINNLSAGLYSVTVTDGTGCSQLMTYFIMDPVINALTVVSNPDCGAEGKYSVDLTVSGGAAPYSFAWSTGATTEDVSGLNSGSYQVRITDANGCVKTVDVVIQPVVADWSCSITPPDRTPVCGTSDNLLSTTVEGATYDWRVESDDGHWLITSGQGTPSITYTAGGNESSATFTLTLTKGLCTQTCTYTLTACVPVITCGNDTTSSIPPPFVGTPIVSAAGESSATVQEPDEPRLTEFRLSAYPNPVMDKLSFNWTAETSEYVQLEIIDLHGKRIAELYAGDVREGEAYRIEWNAGSLTDHLYFYRYASATRTVYGKIFRAN